MNIGELEDKAIEDVRNVSKAILGIVARLPSLCRDNLVAGDNAMKMVAAHYGRTVVGAPFGYMITELPGAATLYRAMDRNRYGVDETVFARLKNAIRKAVCAPFPDAARFALGVDNALMAVAKLRREYDRTVRYLESFQMTAAADEVPPMFARVRQRLMASEQRDATALKRAFERGGVPPEVLSPLAFEAIHDLVFFHTLEDDDRVDFAEHLHDETEASFAAALEALPTGSDIVASNISVIETNLRMLAPTPAQEYRPSRAMAA